MRSKFEAGDKVIITGAHYALHKNHEGIITEVVTKKRAVYPGTTRSYVVWCKCGATIKPKADHMDPEKTLTDMVQ